MKNWFKDNMPGVYKFFVDFFDAMNNKKSGHSLRKWLAVGCIWIMAVVTFEFTTEDNLIAVLTIYSSLITALVITYTAGNISQQKIDKEADSNVSQN